MFNVYNCKIPCSCLYCLHSGWSWRIVKFFPEICVIIPLANEQGHGTHPITSVDWAEHMGRSFFLVASCEADGNLQLHKLARHSSARGDEDGYDVGCQFDIGPPCSEVGATFWCAQVWGIWIRVLWGIYCGICTPISRPLKKGGVVRTSLTDIWVYTMTKTASRQPPIFELFGTWRAWFVVIDLSSVAGPSAAYNPYEWVKWYWTLLIYMDIYIQFCSAKVKYNLALTSSARSHRHSLKTTRSRLLGDCSGIGPARSLLHAETMGWYMFGVATTKGSGRARKRLRIKQVVRTAEAWGLRGRTRHIRHRTRDRRYIFQQVIYTSASMWISLRAWAINHILQTSLLYMDISSIPTTLQVHWWIIVGDWLMPVVVQWHLSVDPGDEKWKMYILSGIRCRMIRGPLSSVIPCGIYIANGCLKCCTVMPLLLRLHLEAYYWQALVIVEDRKKDHFCGRLLDSDCSMKISPHGFELAE